ncbi:GIDE domain-containing protein [Streptomonospora nanhaiensis]|uniref:RING-type E3 ubiquitin transferase n=1 Tax=Streptomonospora nanhaiensis TaxID=1323731 RepID=A0A853BPJ4_9ACTN|nr:GIDE domain-containing protein [Streptomonospora nanhaiensis]MBV2366100.1 E3 ubiquitin ligase family protein [Streptomonospora nanhaiensis]MBX9390868.1 E3 ubiquitin ligase family protein [Streptomonospora nanhaiensis]NYI96576.1 hypothetical protein [Streptomonospora nanhaiensis]
MNNVAVTLQLLALILVGLGCWLWLRAMKARAHRLSLQTTPNFTLGRLAEAADPPETAEVLAQAWAGPDGQLTAPYSQTPCVWFRVEVVHHHWEEEAGDRLELTRVFDLHSHEPFVLRDSGTEALCRPHWITVDDAELVHDRFEADAEPPRDALSPPHLSIEERAERTASTTVAGPAALRPGCTYREWVIRPGTNVFVRAHPKRREDGGLMLIGDEDAPMVVSTHTERELIAEDRTKEFVGFSVLPVALLLLLLALTLG